MLDNFKANIFYNSPFLFLITNANLTPQKLSFWIQIVLAIETHSYREDIVAISASEIVSISNHFTIFRGRLLEALEPGTFRSTVRC